MLIVFLLENEWARRALAVIVIVLAFFLYSIIAKKNRKTDSDDHRESYTRQPWSLDKMVLPHSSHGLAEELLPDMHAELILKDDGTFEAKCPINTFTGKWVVPTGDEESALDEDGPPAFIVEQTTANLGNEVILREEDWFIDMLKDTRTLKIAYADTHLVLRSQDDTVIGMFKQKPAERRILFKK
jgi:hypothetical protein